MNAEWVLIVAGFIMFAVPTLSDLLGGESPETVAETAVGAGIAGGLLAGFGLALMFR